VTRSGVAGVLAGVLAAACGAPAEGEPDAGATGVRSASFAPTTVPSSADELTNPLRGQYQWHDRNEVPTGWPTIDSYYRWNWIDLEPSRGNYNWSIIDDRLAAARASHGRFGFRIMALCQDCSNHTYRGGRSAIPDDLADVSNPLLARPAGDATNYLIPDWNSAAYLDRLQELLQAIAARYRDEPHLGIIDVSGYGNYGEMHLYPFEAAYASSPQRPLTAASAQRLVQMHASAFPGKIVVTTTSQSDVLAAAVASTNPPIGLRIDCLGSDRLGGAENALGRVAGSTERWKSAPVMTEWCAFNIGSSGRDPLIQGEEQVRAYHVSTIGTNFRNAPATAEQVSAFRKANVEAGYRLRASAVSVAVDLAAPTVVQVQSTWHNDNVAPTYLPWRVTLRLRGPVTVDAPLDLDLRTVMPGAATEHSQALTVPMALPRGDYQVEILVEDSQGVSLPMNLAMEGRTDAGAYTLGMITL
jgi:Domain of unknown function (DUF4832)